MTPRITLVALGLALAAGCGRDTPLAGPLVEVSPAAVAAVRDVAEQNGVRTTIYLRLRVVPGGCQGYLHKLDLDLNTSADDLTFRSAGVDVVMLKRQAGLLKGSRIDYRDGPEERGFTVTNPNFEGDSRRASLAALERDAVAD